MIFSSQTHLTNLEVPMLSQLDYVEAHAMQLTTAERNQLSERLIISLDAGPEVEAAWEHVADQREADIASGRSRWIPGDKAMRQLSARLLR